VVVVEKEKKDLVEVPFYQTLYQGEGEEGPNYHLGNHLHQVMLHSPCGPSLSDEELLFPPEGPIPSDRVEEETCGLVGGVKGPLELKRIQKGKDANDIRNQLITALTRPSTSVDSSPCECWGGKGPPW